MSPAANEHSYVLIMAGGAGTRLWPMSRTEHPKQFQAFTGEQTLLQTMAELARRVVPVERLCVMAVPKFSQAIQEQIPDLPAENILFEPARRDNGPAILLGMAEIVRRDPEAVVAVLWSDHLIQNAEGFAKMLQAGLDAAADHPDSLVTVGTNPTAPETGFGYIQMGKEVGRYGEVPVFTVRRFVEKPDLETATGFVQSWDYLWNVGYKMMGARRFLDRFKEVQPELAGLADELEAACAAGDKAAISATYEKLPKQAVEYLFTQHLKELLVIPADLGWSDIGSWSALHDLLKGARPDRMVLRGETLLVDSSDSLVFAKDRPIALVGVKDLVVVDTGDAVLVMRKDAAQSIKQLTQALEVTQSPLL